jgi:hypothetical protein
VNITNRAAAKGVSRKWGLVPLGRRLFKYFFSFEHHRLDVGIPAYDLFLPILRKNSLSVIHVDIAKAEYFDYY